jgi:hypothetical protein
MANQLPVELKTMIVEFSRDRTVEEMVSQYITTLKNITWEQWMSLGFTPNMFLRVIHFYTPGDEPPLVFNGCPSPTTQEYINMGKAYKWLSWLRLDSDE